MTEKYIEINTVTDEILKKFRSGLSLYESKYIKLSNSDWDTVPDLLYAANNGKLYKWQSDAISSPFIHLSIDPYISLSIPHVIHQIKARSGTFPYQNSDMFSLSPCIDNVP